ncbi:MAG TPA: hypothetical protein VMV52_10310 [Candidatus Nanopelagicaceae bacterium]|nr:hypothetical protein [Candidatus Nanopelagicaceae bacterium]
MSFLRDLAGTPHVVDKGVGNPLTKPKVYVEIPPFDGGIWNTWSEQPQLSTVVPEGETRFELQKKLVIHNLNLAITTNIYN